MLCPVWRLRRSGCTGVAAQESKLCASSASPVCGQEAALVWAVNPIALDVTGRYFPTHRAHAARSPPAPLTPSPAHSHPGCRLGTTAPAGCHGRSWYKHASAVPTPFNRPLCLRKRPLSRQPWYAKCNPWLQGGDNGISWAAMDELIKEAELLGRLRHPNVVWVYGVVLPAEFYQGDDEGGGGPPAEAAHAAMLWHRQLPCKQAGPQLTGLGQHPTQAADGTCGCGLRQPRPGLPATAQYLDPQADLQVGPSRSGQSGTCRLHLPILCRVPCRQCGRLVLPCQGLARPGCRHVHLSMCLLCCRGGPCGRHGRL